MSEKRSGSLQFSEDHYEIVKNGHNALKKWREENPETTLLLEGAELEEIRLGDSYSIKYLPIIPCKLKGAKLKNCIFDKINFEKVKFENVTLINVSFINECVLTNSTFIRSHLIDIKFPNLHHLNFIDSTIKNDETGNILIKDNVKFENCKLIGGEYYLTGRNIKFQKTEITDINFNVSFRQGCLTYKFFLKNQLRRASLHNIPSRSLGF